MDLAIVHQRQLVLLTGTDVCKYDIENDTYSKIDISRFNNDIDMKWILHDRISYDRKNALLYITNYRKQHILVLDLSTGEVSKKITACSYSIGSDHLPMIINHDKYDKPCMYSNNYKHSDVLHFFGRRHGYYNEDKQQYVQLEALQNNDI